MTQPIRNIEDKINRAVNAAMAMGDEKHRPALNAGCSLLAVIRKHIAISNTSITLQEIMQEADIE